MAWPDQLWQQPARYLLMYGDMPWVEVIVISHGSLCDDDVERRLAALKMHDRKTQDHVEKRRTFEDRHSDQTRKATNAARALHSNSSGELGCYGVMDTRYHNNKQLLKSFKLNEFAATY